jgi:hypothetical protein
VTEYEYTFMGRQSGVPMTAIFTQDEAHRLLQENPQVAEYWYLVKRPKTQPWQMVAPGVQDCPVMEEALEYFKSRKTEPSEEPEDPVLVAWREKIMKDLDKRGDLESGI